MIKLHLELAPTTCYILWRIASGNRTRLAGEFPRIAMAWQKQNNQNQWLTFRLAWRGVRWNTIFFGEGLGYCFPLINSNSRCLNGNKSEWDAILLHQERSLKCLCNHSTYGLHDNRAMKIIKVACLPVPFLCRRAFMVDSLRFRATVVHSHSQAWSDANRRPSFHENWHITWNILPVI